jgi:DNA polymerase III subunit delta'
VESQLLPDHYFLILFGMINMINIGKNTIIGQEKVKSEISSILNSDRLGHAYLIAGPAGIGKKALALSFAEAVNGIENLSELGELKFSSKSGWMNHPDIHLFIPVPSTYTKSDFNERLRMLADDPYAIVDFANRPNILSDVESKNRKAFYHINYFRDDIRPTFFLKPNEGKRNVIILSNIENMQATTANAFLKVLEEPPENVLIIMTTDHLNMIIPTVLSRCQVLKCSGLTNEEITNGLIQHDQISPDDASYLSRISGGNYSISRYYDVAQVKALRHEIITFLRMSYIQEASELVKLIHNWSSERNSEGILTILNMIEVFLKDIYIFMHTSDTSLVVNSDQIDVISKFVSSLKDANLERMIDLIESSRTITRQNIQAKYMFTVLSLRFSYLMRGANLIIPENEPWHHIPAFEEY